MDEISQLISRILRYFWLILIPALLACTPTGTTDSASRWLPSQVRILDPAESTPNPFASIEPSQDLIALYSRETGSALQIRLDLLDLELNTVAGLPLNPTADIYLAIDFYTGDPASDRDLLITIPAEGLPKAEYSQQPNRPITPVVKFDPLIDSITILIDQSNLPDLRPGYTLHSFLTAPNSSRILDEIAPVHSMATVDSLPMILAFWNTLPAHTPAQALRRWDGAHTGPLGERHGLTHLLEASREHQIPVVLLDLKTPTSLAALDLLGQMQHIASLQRSGLLILPDSLPETYFGSLPSWANQRAAQSSRQTALSFGLTGSPFLYAPSRPVDTIPTYHLIFVREPNPNSQYLVTTRSYLSKGQRYISLPSNETDQQPATNQGLALESRRALLQMALSQRSAGEMAVLGNDLSHSTFGDPQATQATLRFIAEHPWMQVMNSHELQTLPARSNCSLPNLGSPEVFQHPVMTALQNLPPTSISELAWQMFLDLSAPATPRIPELTDLRISYLGEIGNLLAAADWKVRREITGPNTSIRSQTVVDCTKDTDFDGRTECILENADYFALVDPDGGRLALMFAGTSQLVGASSQFVVGLSDHQEWSLGSGPLADPANIPGALAGPWTTYEIESLPDGVRLSSTGVDKTFLLSENGVRIDLSTDRALPYQIPLVVAPESRFNPGWATQYQESEIPQGWVWGKENGPKAEIHVSRDLISHNFQESASVIRLPENPNLGYPPGHFLPYPLAIVDLARQNIFWVEISLSADQPLDQ